MCFVTDDASFSCRCSGRDDAKFNGPRCNCAEERARRLKDEAESRVKAEIERLYREEERAAKEADRRRQERQKAADREAEQRRLADAAARREEAARKQAWEDKKRADEIRKQARKAADASPCIFL
jgi:hypothetical protein